MSDVEGLTISRRGLLTGAIAAAGAVPLSAQAGMPPKLGIVGLGNRAQRHLAALREIEGTQISALSDLQPDRMRAARSGPAAQARTYIDYRELIADRNVDVVVIAVPNYLHAKIAIEAIEAGKDVLLEKPIGLTYEEARSVADAAKKHGRIVGVGMQRQYFSAYRVIAEYVHSGKLGPLRMISQTEYRGDWNPKTWLWTDPKSGKKTPWRHLRSLAGSSLLEFSVHTYGFLQTLLASPLVKCSASGGAVHWPQRSTEDAINVIADYANGARLHHSYCGFARGAQWNLTIVGDNGHLQYDRQAATVRERDRDPVELDLEKYSSEELLETQMYRDFFQAVRSRKPSPLNPEFAIEASKLAYAAWISIDENRIVTGKDFA